MEDVQGSPKGQTSRHEGNTREAQSGKNEGFAVVDGGNHVGVWWMVVTMLVCGGCVVRMLVCGWRVCVVTRLVGVCGEDVVSGCVWRWC